MLYGFTPRQSLFHIMIHLLLIIIHVFSTVLLLSSTYLHRVDVPHPASSFAKHRLRLSSPKRHHYPLCWNQTSPISHATLSLDRYYLSCTQLD